MGTRRAFRYVFLNKLQVSTCLYVVQSALQFDAANFDCNGYVKV